MFTMTLDRTRTLAWLVAMLSALVVATAHAAGPVVTTSLVLEEVLEHGPLFDELEDEAWWSGVDVIDTALPSASSRFWSSADSGAINVFGVGVESEYGWVESAPEPGRDEFCRFWNEHDGCPTVSKESSSSAFAVPRLPPPPPVPPGLGDLIRQLQQRQQQQQQKSQEQVNNAEDDDCLLCQWAALNGTIDLVPNSELSSDNSWVPMLVVVALGSAMLGAVLMITALKCRRLKVLPRGGSCPTLPVGYMVGEGKEGVVQTNVSADIDTISKAYTIRSGSVGQDSSTLGRPRLGTPTLMHHHDVVQGQAAPVNKPKSGASASNEGWPMKFWRKMTGASRDDPYAQDPYLSVVDQSDAVSAVYAELNSVTGSAAVHRTPSVALYHLNTYSEIREPAHLLQPPCTTTIPHPQQTQTAATLHLRRLLSDGTYENAAYALERGVILVEHDAASSSTPSSAYYSDLSNSDRSGSLHNHLWQQRHQAHRPRIGSESHLSAQSLPYAHHHHPHTHHGHCCHHHHHHLHHDQESILRPVRDLMPVALSVVPDNQQVPAVIYDQGSFPRGSLTSSSLRAGDDGSCKRPLPPLPSRQQQRPQRRFAYAVDPQQQSQHQQQQQADQSGGNSSTGSDSSSTLSCVPSEYV